MLKGRNNLVLGNRKSRLVISRPSIPYQNELTMNYINDFLNIKQISIPTNKSPKSPFHVRKIPSSLSSSRAKKRQLTLEPKRKQSTYNKNETTELSETQKAEVLENELESSEETIEKMANLIVQNLTEKELLKQINQLYFIRSRDFLFLLKAMLKDELFPQTKAKKIINQLQYYHNGLQQNQTFVKTLMYISKTRQRLTIQQTLGFNSVCTIDNGEQNSKKYSTDSDDDKQTQHLQKNNKINDFNKGRPIIEVRTTVEMLKVAQENKNQIICIKEQSHQAHFSFQSQFLKKLSLPNLQQFKKGHLELLNSYIHKQPNKIVQMAFQHHKNLEDDMLGYATFLNTNKLGTSAYASDMTIAALDNVIDRDLKQMNKYIAQDQIQIYDKNKVMREFINRTRDRYDTIVREMMSVIDKKTEFCKQFFTKVAKWSQNYKARKDFLENLRNDYCQELFFLFGSVKKFYLKVSQIPCLVNKSEQSIENMVKRLNKIDEIYLIGNHFY